MESVREVDDGIVAFEDASKALVKSFEWLVSKERIANSPKERESLHADRRLAGGRLEG
jgi:hypothetical protein